MSYSSDVIDMFCQIVLIIRAIIARLFSDKVGQYFFNRSYTFVSPSRLIFFD